MDHGKQLKDYITNNRINVSDFAKLVGVDRQTVYQMYKRPKFTMELLTKLKEVDVNIMYDKADTLAQLNEPEEKYGSKIDLVVDSLKYVIDNQKEFITQQKDLIVVQNEFIKSIVK